jgi:hypothetical protein
MAKPSGQLNKTETVAFGYLCARFEQRVTRTFGYPLHAPSFITAGNGLILKKSKARFSFRWNTKSTIVAQRRAQRITASSHTKKGRGLHRAHC